MWDRADQQCYCPERTLAQTAHSFIVNMMSVFYSTFFSHDTAMSAFYSTFFSHDTAMSVFYGTFFSHDTAMSAFYGTFFSHDTAMSVTSMKLSTALFFLS